MQKSTSYFLFSDVSHPVKTFSQTSLAADPGLDIVTLEGGNNKSTYLTNADEGAYQLSDLYDQLIQRASSKDDITMLRPGSTAILVREHILRGRKMYIQFSLKLYINLPCLKSVDRGTGHKMAGKGHAKGSMFSCPDKTGKDISIKQESHTDYNYTYKATQIHRCTHAWKTVYIYTLNPIYRHKNGSIFNNPNTIKSYKILQKLSPKHAAHGVAQSIYPIYRHGKACLSKQPPWRAAGDPSPSTRQVPGSSPGSGGRAACAFFLHPPFLPPSGDSFFRTFPTNPTKVLGLLYTTG